VFLDFASNNYCLQAEVKASLNRGTVRDEKLQQTMNLTLKRLNTYQQVIDKNFLEYLSSYLEKIDLAYWSSIEFVSYF